MSKLYEHFRSPASNTEIECYMEVLPEFITILCDYSEKGIQREYGADEGGRQGVTLWGNDPNGSKAYDDSTWEGEASYIKSSHYRAALDELEKDATMLIADSLKRIKELQDYSAKLEDKLYKQYEEMKEMADWPARVLQEFADECQDDSVWVDSRDEDMVECDDIAINLKHALSACDKAADRFKQELEALDNGE